MQVEQLTGADSDTQRPSPRPLGHKTGVLLLNLGTPDSPKVKDVRRYLKQFLSDPRVIDLPALARWLLVRCVIMPFRAPKSAEAYETIWTPQGSPLMVHSKNLCAAVAADLGPNYRVALGMRYGNPSVAAAIAQLDVQGCDQLLILPLFPHYAEASSGSAIEAAFDALTEYAVLPNLSVQSDFYNHPAYLDALSGQMLESLQGVPCDYLLMSYHGVPERHVKRSETTDRCDLKGPCPPIREDNRYCYRAQCYETSRELAKRLPFAEDQWSVSFQSRLGRTPWIQPYTDEVLPKLYAQGVRNLAICCPAFTADCLETVEEIGLQAKEQWQDLGGNHFHLIPCLNDHPLWVKALVSMIHSQLAQ